MLHDLTTLNNKTGLRWKRINMRKVEHLPAVELIHDLYNQYDFHITALRFRNTVTTWRNGVVNSYAPVFEWDYIEQYLGEKFYRLDKLLLRELGSLYDSNRNFATEYLKSIENINLEGVSDTDLRNILLNIQNFTLGDLYRLNFVQVEHALTSAIKRTLIDLCIEPNQLSSFIVSGKLTEFQKEEIAFANMVSKSTDKDLDHLLQKHWDLYAHMHCAYGETPYTIDYYRNKFDSYELKEEDILKKVKISADESLRKLNEMNSPNLSILARLMVKGGEFRDANKARLGHTMKYKFAVLDEIAQRKKIERKDLSFYSISELCTLLTDGSQKVASDTIYQRRDYGIVFCRSEFYTETNNSYDISKCEPVLEFNNSQKKSSDHNDDLILEGLCASPGSVEGIARIVLSYEDGKKVNEGEIMVAIGTDFDLMDAIQRSSGVITEEGGILSHASVVCRELNKPCCISVDGATSSINEGDYINLDSEKGIIKVIRKI